MSNRSIIKGPLSGFVFSFALAVSIGIAAAAGGDGTGGGTGNGTGGGNRDGSGGGKKKISRQIEVGQVKKQVETETEVQPAETIEVLPEAPAAATEASPEVDAEAPPAPKEKVITVKKTAKARKAAKIKVIVVDQSPSEIDGSGSVTGYEQHDDDYSSYAPSVEYGGGGYSGCQ
ncbi:MAG: hypothetical protein R3D57_04560 [Hyphomicrobiaceae bacterium]